MVKWRPLEIVQTLWNMQLQYTQAGTSGELDVSLDACVFVCEWYNQLAVATRTDMLFVQPLT